MVGEFKSLFLWEGIQTTARGNKRKYTVEVYSCGIYAGDVHRIDGKPTTRSCFKMTAEKALKFNAIWWNVAKACNNIEDATDYSQLTP